jgi:HD-GYP domain-containing protein (c-di-GMP phosphodiesterase class II)
VTGNADPRRATVRHAAAELGYAARDAGELQRVLAVLQTSSEVDGALLASAARCAVAEAVTPEALRLLLTGLAPVLAPQFAGDASRALAVLIEARDPAVRAHHVAVEAAALRLARCLDFNAERTARVGQAARFFDAGKLFVPPDVLYFDGPLDRESWLLVKRHVYDVWTIAGAIPALAPLAPIVRAHHERFDGFGYPDGLSAAEIPCEAAAIALADAWVSVISSRPFRSPTTVREAVLMLEDGRGAQWDPAVVDALLGVVNPRKLKRGSAAPGRSPARAIGARGRRL